MRIRSDHGDRLILSGPPGGRGTVVLVVVVGAVLSGGGGGFARLGLIEDQMVLALMGGLVGFVGGAILLFGVGLACTRDRIVLDGPTKRGRWTRSRLGRSIRPPLDFPFDAASSVHVSFFVDAAPGGGETSSPKVRARLRLRTPRRRIDLVEAEERREADVRAIAARVAEVLGVPVEVGRR